MVIFYKKWKKYNEFQLTKNKMDLNIRKMTNHPPSPDSARLYRKCGTLARVCSQTLAHGNSKNEIIQRVCRKRQEERREHWNRERKPKKEVPRPIT